MRTSIYRESLSVMALTSATRTNGTVNGTTVDRGALNLSSPSVLFVITTGTVTDGSHAFAVQDSDDGTTWGTPVAGSLQGSAPTVVAAGSSSVFDVGYNGPKRFARLTVTTTGATTGGVYSAAAILYGRRTDR